MRTTIATPLAALLLALTASTAAAEKIELVHPNADRLTGTLSQDVEQYVPLELPAGTFLSISVRPDRGSPVRPEAAVIAPDGSEVEIPSDLVSTKKGFAVKDLELEQTGAYMLVLRSHARGSGGYSLKLKATYPTSLKGTADLSEGEPLERSFAALGGSQLTAKVTRGKSESGIWGATPTAPSVLRPGGQSFAPWKVRSSKSGFSFKDHALGEEMGLFHLRFGLQAGTEGLPHAFRYKLKIKAPKFPKRTVNVGDIAVEPVLTALTPSEVSRDDGALEMHVDGRFFQPGARVELRRQGEVWTTKPLELTPHGIDVEFNPMSRPVGRWDVVVRNGSGGEGRLSRSLVVRPDAPIVTAVLPSVVTDDVAFLPLSIQGFRMDGKLSVQVVASDGGAEPLELPVTDLTVFDGGRSLSVDVDTHRRPFGAYDVILQVASETDPDLVSLPLVIERAFEIVNAPPSITASTPNRFIEEGGFRVEVDGAEIEPGAKLDLVLGDETKSATFLSIAPGGGRITGWLDMTAATPGRWAVRVTNTDGQSATLEDAFQATCVLTHDVGDLVLGSPELAIAAERDKVLLAWIESNEDGSGNGTYWVGKGRVVSLTDDDWDAEAFRISPSSSDNAEKQGVAVAYNPDEDAWAVVWCEMTWAERVWELYVTSANSTSGYVFQPRVRRVSADEGVTGDAVAPVGHVATSVWNATETVYLDEFEYTEPRVHYAPWDQCWYVMFTQRVDDLSVSTTYNLTIENYDSLIARLDSSSLELDSSRIQPIFTRPRHERSADGIVDAARGEILTFGSLENVSPNSHIQNFERGIECRAYRKDGVVIPGMWTPPYVYSGRPIVLVAAGSVGTGDLTEPRGVLDGANDELFVTFELTDPLGVAKTSVLGRRITLEDRSAAGDVVELAVDEDHDLIRPRLALDDAAGEILVAYTHDDLDDEARAFGRYVTTSDGQPAGDPVQLGPEGSGLPVVVFDGERERFAILCVTGYGGSGDVRTGTGLRLELLD